MPAITETLNACDAVITLADANGVPVDISGAANRALLAFTHAIESYRVFGDRWIRRLACGQDAALRLDVVYTPGDAQAVAVLRAWYFGLGSARVVRVAVHSGAGADTFTGAFVLARLSLPLEASTPAPILVSAELLPDGAVTHTTA